MYYHDEDKDAYETKLLSKEEIERMSEYEIESEIQSIINQTTVNFGDAEIHYENRENLEARLKEIKEEEEKNNQTAEEPAEEPVEEPKRKGKKKKGGK